MANDRLFIVCLNCGQTVMLGKYYPSCGYNGVADENRAGLFVENHTRVCHPKSKTFDLGGDSGIRIVTEEGLNELGGHIGDDFLFFTQPPGKTITIHGPDDLKRLGKG